MKTTQDIMKMKLNMFLMQPGVIVLQLLALFPVMLLKENIVKEFHLVSPALVCLEEFVWLAPVTILTLAIVLALNPQFQVILTLELIVKWMLIPLVPISLVKMMEFVLTTDMVLHSPVHVMVVGSERLALFLQSTNVLLESVVPLVFVSHPLFPPHHLFLPLLDVSVLMVILVLIVLFLLPFVLTNVKIMVSVFMMLTLMPVILLTLLVSVPHLLLDNTVNGTRPNGTPLHPQLLVSSLL
jgi:hypothetical protein